MLHPLLRLLVIGFIGSALYASELVASRIADNATYGCRRSFGWGIYDATAQRTVVTWNGPGMSICVRAFDHATGSWGEPLIAQTLSFRGTWDYHNYPTLVLAPDGHFLVFYCEHGRAAHLLRSSRPHDIGGTWTRQRIGSDGNCYPHPVVMSDNVYFFYSKTMGGNVMTSVHRSYRLIRSTDSGATWSAPVTVIDSDRRDPERYDEVYLHSDARDHERGLIHLGWEMHGGPNGHNGGVRNRSTAARIAHITVTADGGAVFDCCEPAGALRAQPELGGNNDGATATELRLSADEPLAPGAATSNSATNHRSDLDGAAPTGFQVVVRFADGSRLDGTMADVGDADDGDPELWQATLEQPAVGN